MRKFIKWTAVLLLCAAAFMAAASGLGQRESLISLSYLEERFIPAVVEQGTERITRALDDVWQTVSDTLDQLADGYLNRVGAGQTGGYNDAYRRRSYSAWDILSLEAGGGILVEAGRVVLSLGTVVDVTQGEAVQPGTVLSIGHRYLAAEDDGVVFCVESDAARVAMQGAVLAERSGRPASPFTDVTIHDEFRDAVNEVYARGLFAGTGDGSIFAPDTRLDRAMMMTVLFHLAGDPDEERFSAVLTFPDVKEGEWYETYVRWAGQQGISVGYGDGNFRPLQTMTRREVVQFLYNFAISYLKLELTEQAVLDGVDGVDVLRADGWGEQAMSWAMGAGIIGELRPDDYPSRGEVAVIMAAFAEKYLAQDAPN